MKLRFELFGYEIASVTLEDLHHQADTAAAVVSVVERKSKKAVGKLIGRISTAWVAAGMR